MVPHPIPRRRALAGIGLAVLLSSISALAHHGWSGYRTEKFTLSGIVEGVTLGNPHGIIKARAQDGVWDIVLGPPANQRRAGLTEALVPIGAPVTAYGHRHLDPNRREIKTERLTVAGKTFDIYPERL